MVNKTNFTENIQRAAAAKSASIVVAARQAHDEALADLEKELAETEVAEQEKIRADANIILSRRAASARIAASKIILAAKQKAVDATYAAAKQNVIDMPDKEYKKFIDSLVAKHISAGDEVKTLPNRGGVILRGKKYDKNLSLDALLESARHETESQVVKILYG